MDMAKSKSSNIDEFGYDKEKNTLAIRFKGGGLYHYEGVTQDEFDEFSKAESHGKHFHGVLKSKYTGKKQ